MRIVIDLQGAQTESRYRGIGRYSMSLAKAIVRNAGDHEIIIALSDSFPDTIMPIRNEFKGLVPKEKIVVFSMPGPIAEVDPNNSSRSRVAELIREYFLHELKADIILITSLFEGFLDDAVTSIKRFDQNTKIAVIFYDLIPLLNPERYLQNPVYKEYYLKKIDSLKKADILLSISEYACKEAVDSLCISNEKVFNISTAIEESFVLNYHAEDNFINIPEKYGLVKPYIMHMGAIEPRKNFNKLIEAFSKIDKSILENYQLLLVAQGNDVERDKLRKLAFSYNLREEDVVIISYVPDDYLYPLLSSCSLFVFPSLHEGFGLPALEAMACGAPTIGSDSTSIPEVIGKVDALFDPNSADAITLIMEKALRDDNYRKSLKEHGLVQAKKFSWDITAKKAIERFEKISIDAEKNINSEELYTDLLNEIVNIIYLDSKICNDLRSIAKAIAISQCLRNKRRLFVDISELVQIDAESGIQRVVRSILFQFVNNPPINFSVEAVYGTDDGLYRHAKTFIRRLTGSSDLTNDNEVIEINSGDIFLGLDLSLHLFPLYSSTLDYFRKQGVAVFFIVYDIIPILHPEWCGKGMQEIFTQWLITISQHADGLICISNAVADHVRLWLKNNPQPRIDEIKVDYFHLGADIIKGDSFKGISDNSEIIIRKLKSKNSFLMVGTIEPRKGYIQTLESFELLWEQGLDSNLVFAGKQGWNMEIFADKIINHKEFGARLFWLNGISDEYLIEIYKASSVLVAASYEEGFGLPLIEAAQYKLPIIARDIPVFKEVAGDLAFYFKDSTESKDLADAIKDWCLLFEHDKHPKSDDMPWLTWEQSAKMLVDKLME